jgi:hypothetical protein
MTPAGVSNNLSLQIHIIESALALLELDDGPFVLLDFDYVGDDVGLSPNWM